MQLQGCTELGQKTDLENTYITDKRDRGKGRERKRGSREARRREAQAPPTRNHPTISFSYATLQPDGKCRVERRRRWIEF